MSETTFLKGNWVDLVFILFIIYFVLTNRGFIDTIADIFGFLFSFFISYRAYTFLGQLLTHYFFLPSGIANVAGFFVAWVISEIVFSLFLRILLLPVFPNLKKNRINIVLGYVAGAMQGFFLFLLLVLLIFSLPLRGEIKKDILDSKTGLIFVNLSQSFESKVKNVFGPAISETINFLTIKPESNEVLNLQFKVTADKTQIDAQSEQILLSLVNKERNKRGFSTLVSDDELKSVARSYGREMLVNGFFSHTSQVNDSSPAERVLRDGIAFSVMGENLAYAPDVYLAHQGLMNSEGHKKNILSPEYRKIGIGVVDAGIYGKMFVQEFSD